jgi:hypothetical protein
MAPKAWKEALWFGRSQHNKENKQTTFLNREISIWKKKKKTMKKHKFPSFSQKSFWCKLAKICHRKFTNSNNNFKRVIDNGNDLSNA